MKRCEKGLKKVDKIEKVGKLKKKFEKEQNLHVQKFFVEKNSTINQKFSWNVKS